MHALRFCNRQNFLEAKLHKLCNWANRYVDTTLPGLIAKREFKECQSMKALKTAATEYLQCVTDEDNAFMLDVDDMI